MNENEVYNVLPKLDFDLQDFSMPRWKIGKDGLFFNTMTNEKKPKILAVLVKAARSRFYWPKDYDPKNLPLCYSTNSVYPVCTDYAEKCSACPMGEWTTVNGKAEKPACSLCYDYLLYDIESEVPAVLSLSRSRTGTARALNSLFQTTGVKFLLSFVEVLVKSAKGIEYYDVQFTIEGKNPSFGDYLKLMLENRETPLCGLVTAGEVDDEQEENAEHVEF